MLRDERGHGYGLAGDLAPRTEVPALEEILAVAKPSWVKISQIRTVSVDKLGKKIAAVDPMTVVTLVDGLLELIS